MQASIRIFEEKGIVTHFYLKCGKARIHLLFDIGKVLELPSLIVGDTKIGDDAGFQVCVFGNIFSVFIAEENTLKLPRINSTVVDVDDAREATAEARVRKLIDAEAKCAQKIDTAIVSGKTSTTLDWDEVNMHLDPELQKILVNTLKNCGYFVTNAGQYKHIEISW